MAAILLRQGAPPIRRSGALRGRGPAAHRGARV